jgi:hypothetical protein
MSASKKQSFPIRTVNDQNALQIGWPTAAPATSSGPVSNQACDMVLDTGTDGGSHGAQDSA